MSIFQVIAVQLLTFAGMVLVLRKLLYSETSKALQRLQELNRENEIKEEELRKKGEESQKEYSELVKKANDEADRIIELTRKEAEGLKANALEEAWEEAERIIAAAHSSNEAARAEIAAEIESRNIDFACELLQYALDAKTIGDVHNRLTDEAISGINELNPNKIDAGLIKAEVISPYPLGSDDKRALEENLLKKCGRKIHLEEKIDKKLIAGIIIKMANLVLESSILNKLEEAKRELKRNVS
jgi:F-type H+-transporting ATPase subunit b